MKPGRSCSTASLSILLEMRYDGYCSKRMKFVTFRKSRRLEMGSEPVRILTVEFFVLGVSPRHFFRIFACSDSNFFIWDGVKVMHLAPYSKRGLAMSLYRVMAVFGRRESLFAPSSLIQSPWEEIF